MLDSCTSMKLSVLEMRDTVSAAIISLNITLIETQGYGYDRG